MSHRFACNQAGATRTGACAWSQYTPAHELLPTTTTPGAHGRNDQLLTQHAIQIARGVCIALARGHQPWAWCAIARRLLQHCPQSPLHAASSNAAPDRARSPLTPRRHRAISGARDTDVAVLRLGCTRATAWLEMLGLARQKLIAALACLQAVAFCSASAPVAPTVVCRAHRICPFGRIFDLVLPAFRGVDLDRDCHSLHR